MLPSDQQFRLKWNNHRNTVMHEFELLLRDDRLVDCTLGADGKYIKAHKVVLSACSPYLRDLLIEHFDKHPIILLKDVPFNDLKYMIDYMYCGEVNILEADLPSFLKAAQSLKIKGLADDSLDDRNSRLGYLKENETQNENNSRDSGDEPPIKKPVPAAVLLSNMMPESSKVNTSYKRKQPSAPLLPFQNLSNSQNTVLNNNYNSMDDEADIELENNVDGSDDESLNSEMLEEVMFSSTMNPPITKLKCIIKDDPSPDDKNEDTYESSCLDADSSYNDDSLPQSAGSLADQILAGKNLNELTITSYTENELSTSNRDEGNRPNGKRSRFIKRVFSPNGEFITDYSSNDIIDLSDPDYTPSTSAKGRSKSLTDLKRESSKKKQQEGYKRKVGRPIGCNKRVLLIGQLKKYGSSLSGGELERTGGFRGYNATSFDAPIYSCNQCNRMYRWKEDLATHKRLYCGKQPRYWCPHCPKKCYYKRNLKSHIASHNTTHL